MRPIPLKLRKILQDDPFMTQCIHSYLPGHVCDSPVTFEHAHKYAGKQINELWAIVPVCRSMNNDVAGDDKAFNKLISFYRLYEWGDDYLKEQKIKYSKFDFVPILRLNDVFANQPNQWLRRKFEEEKIYLRNLGVM